MKTWIPYVQVRSNALIFYSLPDSQSRRNQANPLNDLTKEKTYAGSVSPGAKKRITKAVTLLVQSTQKKRVYNTVTGKMQDFRLNFVTLTVSSTTTILTAKEAHKILLEPFLLTARRKWGVKSYIWKAELQKRGQIHYHITTNTFIPWQLIRDTWNNLQRKNGLLDSYKEKYGHYNANSTDVHSVYKIQNLTAYLVKYMAKEEKDGGKTVGKVWDCSLNLKKCNYFTEMVDSGLMARVEYLIDRGKAVRRKTDNCEIVIFREREASSVLVGGQVDRFNALMGLIR